MSSEEKIKLLAEALEEIRQLTFRPYSKNSPTEQRQATFQEKLEAWAQIQAIAARALRTTEDDP